MDATLIGSIVGGAIIVAATILKIVPRRVSNGETHLGKELTDLTRRQLDLLQEMRGEHRVHQLMLEQIGRGVERIERHAAD